MRCKDIDLLAYVDGVKIDETSSHIKECKKCMAEVNRLSSFLNTIATSYAEGKRVDEELEKSLNAIQPSSMKRLPDAVAIRVQKLKEEGITAKIRKVVRKGKSQAQELFEGFLSPNLSASLACPKDITKSGKGKKTKSRNKN